ncbi:MAG: hypothetical protein L7T60_01935 [Flavobacteriaceae bacterium]|nr:hypothetical protein [Flavobacteriaceae bacterium]
MKRSNYIIYLKLITFLFIINSTSCDDMNSIHEDYLQGEQVYAGKLDTLEVRPGYYRAQLEGQTQFLGNSNQIIIEYEDQVNVYEINEENIYNGIYSMILPDLEEKSYEFTVTTQDEIGNLSVSQVVAGNVVGDVFLSDQDPREIIDFTSEVDGTYANFFGNAQSENVIFTTINYENEFDEITVDTLFFEQNRKKLILFKPNGNLTTTSVVQSGLNGIDSLALAPLSYNMPDVPYSQLNKNYMRLVNMPSDNPGNFNGADPNQYLFDGVASWDGDDTFTYNSGPNSLPHHFTVDLGVKTNLRRIDLNMIDPAIDASSNATHVQIWGRDNLLFAETETSDEDMFINAGWVLLHEEQINSSYDGMASLNIAPLSSLKRFIRVRTTASVGSQEVKFTELTFYGEDTESISLDKSLHSLQNMPSDNPGTFYGADPSLYLFDNNTFYFSDTNTYHSGENAIPGHFTIDLGVSTFLSKVDIDFRPNWSFSGNTPNELEIWGRADLTDAETLPAFESSGNSVISEPVSTASFEDAGWILLHTESLDGSNTNDIELNFNSEQKSRYIRVRYTSTVGESACQFVEMEFNGFGSFPIN